MIIGRVDQTVEEVKRYGEVFHYALKYLKDTDFSSLQEGRYELEKGIFALLQKYQAKSFAESRPENHVKYIDIQYIVAGQEQIGWALLTPAAVVTEDLLQDKDLCFYSTVETEVMTTLTAGMFAIYFPEDVHRPGVRVGDHADVVTKVVVKIPVDLVK
ncbi:MAG: YhcH/YjgK/YiaL family protein [Sporomusaceae bacterium]|nr:YhcH/YjgK/YiaL family protein [Sporomusaceae bacterium]